jgi:hypothetical protein
MRTYLECVPPLSLWMIPLAALALFLSVAELGVRRGWKRPATRAFWLVWALIGLVALISGLGTPEPTRNTHLVPASVRSAAVTLVSAFVFLGAALSGFNGLRRRSLGAAAAAAAAGGAMAVPIAIMAGLFLACALDLGCV